jgi:uncharacterized protein YciI
MSLKKGSRYYVRIDTLNEDKAGTEQDYQDHLAYVKRIAGERYFLGGGFYDAAEKDCGGMAVFEAENIAQAQTIAQNDPLIERGLYRCEVFAWNLAVLSESIGG